jgi:hypothetical protein
MWALLFILMEGVSSLVHAQPPSDDARHKLVALIGDVHQADGRQYHSRDHLGNTMDCVKIIKRNNSEEFIGVYHTFINDVPRVNLAVSDDLITPP